ncbi:MAG: AAA family ATPase, partial [Deltaproteobacteria bacterium]|nr:AAA family ATPase [Deltaproteobacteria bacterium]
MNIKSIEITGFKSFVEKVCLNFIPGITALVGPNGCGKSNIVDAFRWVMGEQSAKQLRGKTMEDIIFNGSETLKPLGSAEVSITFSNENGKAPFQYSQYSEIMVTRRLFRSGESDFFINKTPCRLKDITELFLDTGVGPKAYSIIEQGKVEQVINSKPQERRLLIDEAAGISKYKSRKKEALSKIESTKDNLLRVDDIIVEVKRQLNSIKRQASKLKRYQDLKEDIKKIELNSSLLKYASLKDKHLNLKEQLDHCKKDEIKTSTQISSIEASFEAEKIDLNEEERIYHLIQEEIFKTSSLYQKEESRLEYLNRELLSVKDQHHQRQEQTKNINARMEAYQNEIKILEEKNLAYNQKIRDCTSYLVQNEEQLFKFKEASFQLQSKIELEKNNLIELLTELAHLNNCLTQLEKNHLTLLRKIENNKEETQNQATKYSQLEKAMSVLKEDQKMNKGSSILLEEEKVDIDKHLKSSTEDLQQNEIALAKVKEQWEKSNSLLLSLQELQEKFEECDTGVRSIMLRDNTSKTERNGVCGLVADFIESDPQYETALEAVLGEKLHYIIFENQFSGIEAIEYLKTQSLGRASVIPMQIRESHPD